MAATAITPPSRMSGAYSWPLRLVEVRPRARPTARTTMPDHGGHKPEQDAGVAEGSVHRWDR